jgi:uncharacterized CHY-type Zn-finger protein
LTGGEAARITACKSCHEALADHPIQVWPRLEASQFAILCGACHREISVMDYLASEYLPANTKAWDARGPGNLRLCVGNEP